MGVCHSTPRPKTEPTEPSPTEDLRRYTNINSLFEAVEAGDTVLIKASWLRALAKSGGCLMRRQDLPPDAIMPIDELRRIAKYAKQPLLNSKVESSRAPVISISYCWMDPNHPDPDGRQLRRLGSELDRMFEAESKPEDPAHPDVWGKAEMSVFEDAAVFLDFMSMFQKNRSEDEQMSFKRGLRDANLWYAHQLVTVILLTQLPAGAPNDVLPYAQRGWPTFERSISHLIKRSSRLYWDPIVEVCSTTVTEIIKPPVLLEEFRQIMATKSFTNGADKDVVIDLYGKTVTAVLSQTPLLAYTGLGWSDEDVFKFASVLPVCVSAERLHLDENPITDSGIEELCSAMCKGCVPKLQRLYLGGMDTESGRGCITDKGAAALAKAAGHFAQIKRLYLQNNLIGASGAQALAEAAWNLEELWLDGNQLDDSAKLLVAKACKARNIILKPKGTFPDIPA